MHRMIDKKNNDVCFVSILRQCGPVLKNELQMLMELMLIKELHCIDICELKCYQKYENSQNK